MVHGMRVAVYVDFDGTIAPNDPTDALLARYADPAWRGIEEEWQIGRLSSRECMRAQVELLRVFPDQLDQFANAVEIDPSFPEFLHLCRRFGASVVVVSDGLDRVIERALAMARIELPFFANKLISLGGDRWKLIFPYARNDCRSRMGNCKCGHGIAMRGQLHVMIGDGQSDFCIAERANFVLSKSRLAAHCRARGLPHVEIEDFADATAIMARWFTARAAAAQTPVAEWQEQ
jgi:2-hydroxy-3-keto-5-methylthiopentenyl-1-phosphate phosphatase